MKKHSFLLLFGLGLVELAGVRRKFKKKLLLILCACFLSFGLVQNASAIITADGSVDFNFSAWATAPVPYFYGWSYNYYGDLGFYNTQTLTYSYAWDPYGQVFLDSNYIGQKTFGQNVLNGQWDPITGNAKGNVVAVSPQNIIQANAGVNLGNPYRFLGPYITLPDFSYLYDIKLTKDDVADYVGGGVQLELGYWYGTGSNYTEVKLYSDYAPNNPNFRNNWVWLYSGSNDGTMQLQETGEKIFSGYQTLDGQPHQWFIEYGMGLGGSDISNTTGVVPEPATMLLLGSGLIGLAGYGRKKFFKK
jgi:hypothetical protein